MLEVARCTVLTLSIACACGTTSAHQPQGYGDAPTARGMGADLAEARGMAFTAPPVLLDGTDDAQLSGSPQPYEDAYQSQMTAVTQHQDVLSGADGTHTPTSQERMLIGANAPLAMARIALAAPQDTGALRRGRSAGPTQGPAAAARNIYGDGTSLHPIYRLPW
ncbi:hypothetical protein [Paraburkholderia sp. BL10I2N1]|uniref:hypothetical protein n=1 Tax=Paraburkholderia sp. BL10I2N1 TaxID=1938796 RepID=UPI00105F7871|nr:hypothetical protein [Paraburkholderia sp. BL10I2N1]TDN67458.1 hypothetical protein B0G77_0735 [Paraburkholderia sp. BL10I2N1]